MARAVAAAGTKDGRKVAFFYAELSKMLDKYVGGSEKLVAALFQAAKRHAPAIVFFDELDSIAAVSEWA